MAGSKDVAKQDSAPVPDLIRPALEIGSEDLALPKIKVGQYMTEQVKAQLVSAGDIFSCSSSDDAEVLWEHESKDDGVLIHILSLRKGKSINVDGELVSYEFNDPDAPADAWTTYTYTCCLPEVDGELPYKWLLTRTGRPAAQQMNTVLKKNEGRGPGWASAFRIDTAKRENKKGTYYVARVKVEEAKPENVEVAEQLALAISSSQPTEPAATGETVAI